MILFDEPAEAYHRSGSYGSTHARDYLDSPQKCKDRCDGLLRFNTDAMLFGTTSHLSLLEPERYAKCVAFKPEGMSFATTDGKNWRKEQAGKIIVSHDDAEHLRHMHARMPKEVRAIFDACRKEVTVRTQIDGVPVQCRPDLWDIDGRRKWDLKTARSVEDLEATIFRMKYHVADRWYDRVIAAETGEKCQTSGFVFVESAPPYRWRIVDLDPDFRAMGEEAVSDVLSGIAARMKSGCWEDTGDLHVIASPPRWAEDLIPTLTGEEE